MTRFLMASAMMWSLALAVSAPSSPEVPYVSLIQIIATPEKFDGKRLVVFGLMDFEREADLLFPSKDKYDNVILTDTLWIEPTEEMGKSKSMLNLKYVRIDGVFHAGPRGRFRFAVGGIDNIHSCTPWSNPNNPGRENLDELFRPQ
jgi:hypothetical protein